MEMANIIKPSEPVIQSNDQGIFSFEWISDQYPTSIRLGTKLTESNQSKNAFLLPMLPPPPPPENPAQVKNYFVNLNKPGRKNHRNALPVRHPF
jgi:hypothetical protein